MTLLINSINADYSTSVKYTLTSYRALSDGRNELNELSKFIEQQNFLLSNWKVRWIGICAVLRTAYEVIGKDSRSCIHPDLRNELNKVWNEMKEDKEKYSLFWNFLKYERDQILHQYDWRAYEVWLNRETGSHHEYRSLLTIGNEDERAVLLLRHGPYAGQNSMELLTQCADLAEEVIYGAIRRSGFEPDEEIFLKDFAKTSEDRERKARQQHRQDQIIKRRILTSVKSTK